MHQSHVQSVNYLLFSVLLLGIDKDGEQCGRQAGGALCASGKESLCCSQFGWCGNTDDYCGSQEGCQSQCPGHKISTLPSLKKVIDTDTNFSANKLYVKYFVDQMLKHRNDNSCEGKFLFYSYSAFICASARFRYFGTTGDTTRLARKREIAAFFAQTSHETTGGTWATAPDGPYAWGYCFINEQVSAEQCGRQAGGAPCAAGKKYFGRGPIQISHNYNYGSGGQAGKAIGVDLLNNPDLVATDATISFKSAFWEWMTAQSPKPSCHDVITGRWSPSSADSSTGTLIRIGWIQLFNLDLECGHGSDSRVQDRIGFYRRYCGILGVSPGDNLDCGNQRSFGLYTKSMALCSWKEIFSGFGTTGDTTARKAQCPTCGWACCFITVQNVLNALYTPNLISYNRLVYLFIYIGGWASAPCQTYAWGYCFITEQNAQSDHCTPSNQWPCAPGRKYFGRGPIQISQ
uniref:chitinase n=2 Tax=Musa TaxID=4640 RepID=Q6R8K3_MUSAC|nr:basic class I chitinase [Musa acuminata]